MTDRELQLQLIHAIIVAGKSAKFAQKAVIKLFGDDPREPFDIIQGWLATDRLKDKLLVAKTGNYKKIELALTQLANSDIDLRKCYEKELESIHGIGYKTSRFFLIWTRPDYRCAVLDVHILRWLHNQGYPNIPKSTPSSISQYLEIEELFISIADKMDLTPRQLDEKIWIEASGFGEYNPNYSER